MERSTIFNGKISSKWAIFNSELLSYQRVTHRKRCGKAMKTHDFPRKIVYKWLMMVDVPWFSTSLVCPGVLDGALQKLHSIIIGWQGPVRYQTSSNSSKWSQTCKNTLNLISRIFVNCFRCFFSFHKSLNMTFHVERAAFLLATPGHRWRRRWPSIVEDGMRSMAVNATCPSGLNHRDGHGKKWWFNGHFMVISRWFNGPFMGFQGDLTDLSWDFRVI